MDDHSFEKQVLIVLWSTLRNHFSPELTSALAKDRAKRADAALLRLIAGYGELASLREAHAKRYDGLLVEAQGLARTLGAKKTTVGTPLGSGDGNPAYVGVPGVSGELESTLTSLFMAKSWKGEHGRDFDRLLHGVVKAEASLRGEYESRVARISPRVTANDLSRNLTVEIVQRYLSARPEAGGAVAVRTVNEIPGGRSKRTVLVSLSSPGHLPAEVVLRFDTGRGVGTSVIDEYPLLAQVARLGLPVPEPLWLESSNEPFGFPCIVFRRMPGSAAGDLMEGAFRKEPATGRALAGALGRVHGGGAQLITGPARRQSAVPDTHDLLNYYWNYWREKKPFPSLVVEAAFIWLFEHIDDGLGPASVVQADTGFHNLLMDDQGHVCLLDWEFAHFGDPAEDLASCRPAVEKCMPWPDFMAEYQAHGGLDVSDFRLRYFEIWRPLRNAVVCGTVMHSIMHGQADDIDPVTISLSTFARLQADLAKSLDAALT